MATTVKAQPNPHYMTNRAKSPGMLTSKLARYHERKAREAKPARPA